MEETIEQPVEEQVEEQQEEQPVHKYQELLNRAATLREAGAINSAELTVVSIIIQGLFALGMDLATDIRALGNNGFSDGSDGGEGETSQMDIDFEGDSGDESAV
tara:strand:+ start:107 stop:418 length:312 start_codon:yes stop_codon:yes gene_type:complete